MSPECSTSDSTEVSTLSEGGAPVCCVLWDMSLLSVNSRSMENQTKLKTSTQTDTY